MKHQYQPEGGISLLTGLEAHVFTHL